MCTHHYIRHSCGHAGDYLGITTCANKQDTAGLLERGISPTAGRIRSNAILCSRDSSREWSPVEMKCEACRRRDDEELGKMGLSYVRGWKS